MDPFTKKIAVVPVSRKRGIDWVGAMKIFSALDKPKVVFTDPDSSMGGEDMEKLLSRKYINVAWVKTKARANNAERAIRTIKRGLDERLENLGPNQWAKWADYPPQVLHKYNNVEKSSVTRMTAEEATKPQNEADVRTQLAIHAKHEVKYPEIKVGDKARIFQKKKQFAKERVSTWEDAIRTVVKIKERHGQSSIK